MTRRRIGFEYSKCHGNQVARPSCSEVQETSRHFNGLQIWYHHVTCSHEGRSNRVILNMNYLSSLSQLLFLLYHDQADKHTSYNCITQEPLLKSATDASVKNQTDFASSHARSMSIGWL